MSNRWTKQQMDDRKVVMSARNAEADAAYETELVPARLPLTNPNRVPYPIAVRNALVAYDKVIAKWRPRLFR